MKAADAYDAFAPIYDEFNSGNDYEGWFSVLLPALERHGLRHGRLLDVGCGTGRAFPPMLRRGWEIQGCDVSTEMLAQAGMKFGDSVTLAEADARDLPSFGEFELVWALNDVINYLVGDGDLEKALAGMRANLSPDGLVVFDANSLYLFQESFTTEGNGEILHRGWRWEGLSSGAVPGGVFEARLSGAGVEPHIHRERHYTIAEVRKAMEAVGVEPVAVFGQTEEDGRVILDRSADELSDLKIIFVGRVSPQS